MLLSINQLAQLTEMDRRTVTSRVANLPSQMGPKNAHLYDSAQALKAIFVGGGGVDWGEELKKQNALLAKIEREIKEKERPPISVVHSVVQSVFAEAAAVIKASGLPEDSVNKIFANFRGIPARLKW